jgi:uncharacterized protein
MTKSSLHAFDEHETLQKLKHFLPAQAPLKDFVHHNTLHGFQHLKFNQAITHASAIFGYRVSLSLAEYRALYKTGKINASVLDNVIAKRKGTDHVNEWREKLLKAQYTKPSPLIGRLRATWKREYQLDMDSLVHPLLFRILCSYLDQGIAIWNFPVWHKGFLSSLREIESRSFASFFRSSRARNLLIKENCQIVSLLRILIGNDESLYEHYLFDQQFIHQGWSGMVATLEAHPQALLDHRKINLHDLICLELLLEIDALDAHYGMEQWLPLEQALKPRPEALFADVGETELDEVTFIWQEAFEWSYYDEVLNGLQVPAKQQVVQQKNFQALFCIDDRSCSIRRQLENQDQYCETFGTPGHFGVEFFYKPDHGKFYDKLCPAPVTPEHLIKEIGVRRKQDKDIHFTKRSHSLFQGWFFAQTLGFWSAVKLLINIFKPSVSPSASQSFLHMHKQSKLTIENKDIGNRKHDLQIGFTVNEMADRVENVLKSIGLVNQFASLVYVIGHGSSSVNNPHYAAYDCGACSGRPGSVNARVFCFMANHKTVRKILQARNLFIPDETLFVSGLHDTARDELVFFDEDLIDEINKPLHRQYEKTFARALQLNARERARRFESIDFRNPNWKIHKQIKRRSVSLFEPRPELNHATNALCIVGRRSLTRHLFFDRRSFLNSFDYRVDPDGKYLFTILKAAAPVCGGINLEYYFSRVDNQKLGAGTKLPHNVMGLFGVANGIDGDLRPGLPSQMIEVHDPVRLLMIVEHFPEVVLNTIQQSPETYEWFKNAWINLVAFHPETHEFYLFESGEFKRYKPGSRKIYVIPELDHFLESHLENMPVYSLK